MTLPPLGYYDHFLRDVSLPRMWGVRVDYEDRRVEDVPGTVREELLGCSALKRAAGKRVALAVGSRGLANLPVLVKTTVEVLREQGADVFLVPAMGSHGGATAEGQRLLLEQLGVSEETMGVPVLSEIEPVEIGRTEEGMPVYFDANAAGADWTVTIARVKPHTSFRGAYESGIVKMNVIGLGKQKGADFCHARGMENMADNLEKLGRISIEKSNLLLSLCVLENAYDHTHMIRAIAKEDVLRTEPDLLKLARTLMPRIPFQNLDMLVVDEIGKDITGAGMDPNIIQRFSSEHMSAKPFIKSLVVLDLTDQSDGNANGAGFADVSTRRLYEKIKMEKAYVNALTARVSASAKLPLIMDNDLTAMKAGLKLAGAADGGRARIARIRNTLCLGRMEISEALLEEAAAMPNVRTAEGPAAYAFDEHGDLPRGGFLY